MMPAHLPHDLTAARLLELVEAEPNPETRALMIARAAAYATLALAEAQQVRNLIALLAAGTDMEHPLAHTIIRRNVRRRIGLLPPLTRDGTNPNGGDPDGLAG